MIDKYTDPNYGNTWKTMDSIFTVREIEMFCREWGWHHVEHFIKKYNDMNDQNWLCQAGIGYFIGVDGKEYHTHNTFRTTEWEIGPYDKKKKEEFKRVLKVIAGDYYWKGKRDDYYFYDVLMPRNDYELFDAWGLNKMAKRWPDSKMTIEEPNEYAIEHHGQKLCKVILYHMGVSNGQMWEYKHKKYTAVITDDDNFWKEKRKELCSMRNEDISINYEDCIMYENGIKIERVNSDNFKWKIGHYCYDEIITDNKFKLTPEQRCDIEKSKV